MTVKGSEYYRYAAEWRFIMNNWILHVEGLGKIKSADIEVSPFNLYIGDNNSGKSYIMTVIYGLLNIQCYYRRFKIDTTAKA